MRKRDYSIEEKYAVFVQGRNAPRKLYNDLGEAEIEAIRLTAENRLRAYVVKLVSMFKAPSNKELAEIKIHKENIEKKIARKLANNNTR
jgi:hypothetical protein